MARALTAFDSERFCTEYVKDLNVARAAARAAISQRSGHALMDREDVQARIAELKAERAERVQLDADEVLRQIYAIATVDTNEIVEVRRRCCRHCYGEGFRYQYHDERERSRARIEFLASLEGLVEEFEDGGIGFDLGREPNLDCPRCGGEGTAYVHVKDTRTLSPAARAIFAGAKETRDGVEVRLHSKDKHLELLMRHLGLLDEQVKVKVDIAERILQARKRVGATRS